VTDHDSEAQGYIHLAEAALADVSDPGERANVYALLALSHAMLSTAEEVRKVSSTLWEMEDAFCS
jgi:hypothetical protein